MRRNCPNFDVATCRSPSGERGLKSPLGWMIHCIISSLPIRGAWIEISATRRASARRPRRSPSGERGLKLDGEGMANLLTGSRSPSGERGLKCENPDFGRADGESLPIRGAWIEINRGDLRDHGDQSLPIRGAWIEIVSCTAAGVVVSGSLPIRGAWIEIKKESKRMSGTQGRSPSGERGLKSCTRRTSPRSRTVAPHPGSVD